MTVEQAQAIARDLIHGPLPKETDPTPSVQEAIEVIHDRRRTCGHTWLTGDAAENVLRKHRKRRRK